VIEWNIADYFIESFDRFATKFLKRQEGRNRAYVKRLSRWNDASGLQGCRGYRD